ncbi:MAG: O-antigen ligase family protein [Gammaproteobacteria bacterium]
MTIRIVGRYLYRNQEALLLALTLFLFTSKSLYNVPFAFMALLGLYRLIRAHGSLPAHAESRFYCLLFFSLWIPMVIAFMDPVNLERTARTVWPYLRFLLAGIYVLYGMRERNPRRFIENAFFIIITVWSLDAVLQFITGWDVFGYPYVNGVHITGMFYPDLTIGHALAGLSALYFDSLRQRSRGRPWIWLLLIPLVMVVFLCGRRSIWFMFAVNAFGYLAYRFYLTQFRKQFVIHALLISVVAAAILAALYLTQEPIQKRVAKTMGLFSTNIEEIDRATSSRVDIWRTSWRMFQDNWINGVGPRGFRYVYRDYADPDFKFYETSVTHPHMVILEIAAESGVIGLAGYLLFLYFLASMARRYLHNETCFACFIGIFAATVPINTHVAFYGSYWSSILWWMIIYLAIHMHDREEKG